jgi:hypothetical protein
VKDRDVLNREDPGQQTAAFAAEQQLQSGERKKTVIITRFALTHFPWAA